MTAVSPEAIRAFDEHHRRVEEMSGEIAKMRAKKFPDAVVARVIAYAPMRLYGEAREKIFPKEN